MVTMLVYSKINPSTSSHCQETLAERFNNLIIIVVASNGKHWHSKLVENCSLLRLMKFTLWQQTIPYSEKCGRKNMII